MENELLTILEQLERDKGISKETLIEAVESAVASAAKKIWTVDKEEDVITAVRIAWDQKGVTEVINELKTDKKSWSVHVLLVRQKQGD